MLLIALQESYKIVADLREYPFDACAIRILDAVQTDYQVVIVVPDVVCVVHAFLNTLTPFEFLILIPSIIVLKFILVAAIVFAHTVPSFLLVGTDGDQKEIRIYPPDLLHFIRIAEPIDNDATVPNPRFVYSTDDLLDPVADTFLATFVSMPLEHLSPAFLALWDRLMKLLNLGSNVVCDLESTKAELRLGKDATHCAATTPERSRQTDHEVGSIAIPSAPQF